MPHCHSSYSLNNSAILNITEYIYAPDFALSFLKLSKSRLSGCNRFQENQSLYNFKAFDFTVPLTAQDVVLSSGAVCGTTNIAIALPINTGSKPHTRRVVIIADFENLVPGVLNFAKGVLGHKARDKRHEGHKIRADIDLAAAIRPALGQHQHPGF